MWVNLIFLVTLVIPNRDLPHQLNVCTEKVVKMKRDKNVAIFLRNFAHCAIMILIMLQQHLRNGFKIFLNSHLNFHTFDYYTSDIRCFPKFQLVKALLLDLFMSFGTIFSDVILGWYYNNLGWKLSKQTSYWSKTGFFLS